MKRLTFAVAVMLFSAAVYAQDNKELLLKMRGVDLETSLVNYEGETVKHPFIQTEALYAAYFEGNKVVSPFIGPYALEDIDDDLNMRIAQVLNHKDICNQDAKPSARPTGGMVKTLKFMKGNDAMVKITDAMYGASLAGEDDPYGTNEVPSGAIMTPAQIYLLKQIPQESNKQKADSLRNEFIRQFSPEQNKKTKEEAGKLIGY